MSSVWYICIVFVMVNMVTTKLICPKVEGPIRPLACRSECSPSDDTCKTGTKCCFTYDSPCGHRCIVPKEDTAKPGQCSLPDQEKLNKDPLMCEEVDSDSCEVDNDCNGNQKCCRSECQYLACVSPQ